MPDITPIAPDLFTHAPTLIGSKCANCAEYFFPIQKGCANCSSEDLDTVDLGARGTLWSWTVQHFMPKPPFNSGQTKETYRPYALGLVEMECGIKVKARLAGVDFVKLKIGMPLSLVLEDFRSGDEGIVSTFAFGSTKEETA